MPAKTKQIALPSFRVQIKTDNSVFMMVQRIVIFLSLRTINITCTKLLTGDIETRLIFILSNCLDFELYKNYDISQNSDQHLQVYKFKQRIIDILGIILYPSKVF